MKDCRLAWARGDELQAQGRAYRVESLLGMGSNSIVYQVSYTDGLSSERHHALLKELYPALDGVRREAGWLNVSKEAEAAFAQHRQSFLQGNEAHLRQLHRQAGRITGNIDSFELNGTLYTLLDYHASQTLDKLLEQEPRATVERSARRVLSLLDALAPFHEENLLHLDVSPDNVLILPVLHGYEADCEPMMLIDYNSVWDQKTDREPYFSSKAGYSAPEARLCRATALTPATDLFSVCAIFYQMLTGRPLTENECCGQFLSGVCGEVDRACEALPQTARLQAVRIIRKGIQPLSGQRYQSIDELRQAMMELLNRIFGKGVTHAALWEASLRSLRDHEPPRRPVNLSLQVDNHILSDVEDALLADPHPMLLQGSGGSGKTTLFKALHRRYSQHYSPLETVCYYLPLFRWQGRTPFLMRCLSEYIQPEKAGSSIEEVVSALTSLLRQPLPDGKPRLLLLLDGLNETGINHEALLREIRELARLDGVRVIVSSRNASDRKRLPDGFGLANLLPPDTVEIDRFLRTYKLDTVTTPDVRAMLNGPLLMQLYADTWDAWRDSGESLLTTDPDFSTPDALRQRYLEGQLLRFESLRRESETACLRARYAVEHLLPRLAAAMHARPALTQQQAVVELATDYRELRGKAFAHAYPAYLGKSRLLLAEVRNAEEWYDLMIREVLCNQLSLLVEQPDGELTLLHESFAGGLRAENRVIRHRLNARRFQLAGIIGFSALLLIGILWLTAPLKPDSISRAEQTAVDNLINAGCSTVLHVGEILKAQQNIRNLLADGTGKASVQALIPLADYTPYLTDVPWAKANLNQEAWTAVLQAPEDTSWLYLSALLVLTDSFDGSHTHSYQAEQLSQYDDFCALQKTSYLLMLYAAFSQAPQEARSQLYEQLQQIAPLTDIFVRTARPNGDLADAMLTSHTEQTLLEQTLYYQLAQNEAEKWPGTTAMAEELIRRLP